jgi:2-C-methyl-D-erythritol 4-phosphate cytidylyltransferase
MFEDKRIGAILLIGGEGARFGSKVPKQFLQLGDKQIFQHSLDTLKASGFFDKIVLVCHPDWMVDGAVQGGKTRQLSVYAGLRAFEEKPDIILIHDGVRPFVTEAIIRDNLRGAMAHGAVDTCIPSTDTLVQAKEGVIESIPKREEFFRGQTPQTFRYEWIWQAHERAIAEGFLGATDDCQLVLRMGKKIHVVQGDERNLKITTELDLLLAEKLLFNSAVVR